MKTELIFLKEAEINANCPECYATDGLTLSFKQQKISTRFMTQSKDKVIELMHCTKCETDIFPGRYTDDIQRVYDYHKRSITLEPSNIRLSTISYSIIVFLVLLIGVLITYLVFPEAFGL